MWLSFWQSIYNLNLLLLSPFLKINWTYVPLLSNSCIHKWSNAVLVRKWAPQTGNLYGQYYSGGCLFFPIWLSRFPSLTFLNAACYPLPTAGHITQYRTGQGRNNGKLSFVAFRALVQSRAGRDCNLFYCDHFLAKMQNKTGFNLVLTGQIHAPCVGKGVASMFKKMLQTC